MSGKSEFVSAFGTAFEVFKSIVEEIQDLGGDDADIRKLLADRDASRRMAKALICERFPSQEPGPWHKRTSLVPTLEAAVQVLVRLAEDVAVEGGRDLDLHAVQKPFSATERRRMAKALVGDRSEVLPEIYPFTPRADVDRAIPDGRYDYYDKGINSRDFPPPAVLPATLEAVLVKMNHETVEELVAELGRLGFRPGTLHELLAFGASYPDHYRSKRVVALGTVRRGTSEYHKDAYPIIEDHFSWSRATKRCLDLHPPLQDRDYHRTLYLAIRP